MKIIYVITKANWGGAQRYVYDLATAAKERGDEVLVAYGTPGLLVRELEKASIRTACIAGLSRDVDVRGEGKAVSGLKKLFKEERPDVVHVNSSKGGLALLAARFARVPRIVFTAHGFAFNEDRPFLQKLLLRVLYMVTMWLADVTICVSNAIYRDASYVPFARRVVVKSGISAPVFRAREDARAALLPSAPPGIWLGMVAELHPTKRVTDAIDALPELPPNTILVVMGEGEEREFLEKHILEKNLSERVFLVGFTPEAPTYLSAFDIFLMPSRTEALAYALIEAGYAGLPVVASNVGGIPEIVRNNESGLLIPPLSPSVLAEAVRALIENPKTAAQYGATLKERVSEKFSKGKMVRDTFALYKS